MPNAVLYHRITPESLGQGNVLLNGASFAKEQTYTLLIMSKFFGHMGSHGPDYIALSEHATEFARLNQPQNNIYIIWPQCDPRAAAEYSAEYSAESQISDNVRFYQYYQAYGSYFEFFKATEQEVSLKDIKKHFLCLLKRPTPQRVQMAHYFHDNNLIKKSHLSLVGEIRTTDAGGKVHNTTGMIPDSMIAGTASGARFFQPKMPYYSHCALTVDVTKPFNGWDIPLEISSTSFLNVVMETDYYRREPFFTEKTFKAIYFKQPFILYSAKGSIALLKQLGFKTFGGPQGFIDESYDCYTDVDRRLNAVQLEIKRIGKLSIQAIRDLQEEITPILDFNFDRLRDLCNEWKVIESAIARCDSVDVSADELVATLNKYLQHAD